MLPKFFKGAHLQDLDAAEYEESPAIAFNMSFGVSPNTFSYSAKFVNMFQLCSTCGHFKNLL